MKETLKKVLFVIILLIIVIGLTGCSSKKEETEDLSGLAVVNRVEKENYSTYLDANKVCFDYPADWISLSTDEMPMFVTSSGKGTSVNMTSQKVASDISFSDYIESAKTKIKQEMTVKDEIEKQEINLNGRRAYTLSYTAIDSATEITMKIIQVIIRVEDTMYILTVGSVEEFYEEEKEAINTISVSFRYEG